MKLFRKQHKKKECCCKAMNDRESIANAFEKKKQGSRIKILGTGCANCTSLAKNVREAMFDLHMNEEIEQIHDIIEIASYGVISTPALVINGKVVAFGKVLSKNEVVQLLESSRFI